MSPIPDLKSLHSMFSGLPLSFTWALNIDLRAPRLDSRINDVGYVGILWGAVSWHLSRLQLDTTPSFGPEAIKALKRDEVIFERTWKSPQLFFFGTCALGEPFGLYLTLKNSWNETPWYGFSCLKLLVFWAASFPLPFPFPLGRHWSILECFGCRTLNQTRRIKRTPVDMNLAVMIFMSLHMFVSKLAV